MNAFPVVFMPKSIILDAVIYGVIGGVAGLALLCCLVPCICFCCYCGCRYRRRRRKNKKLLVDEIPSHPVSSRNHASLTDQPSADIREAMESDIDNKTTEV